MTAVAGVLGLVALLATGWGLSVSRDSARSVVRSYLELPPNAYLSGFLVPALSADGSLAVVRAIVDGRGGLLSHRLEDLEFTPIPGAERGDRVAFSPDGGSIVFRAGGQDPGLRRLSLEGGTAVEVVQGSPNPNMGAHWANDGTIYFTPTYESGVWGVSSEGGTPFQISTPDTTSRELGHWWPQLLPDGEYVIFTAYRSPGDSARIKAVSLRTGVETIVQDRAFYARYSPTGHLLFARGQTLYAAPFDIDQLTTTGVAEPVIDGIATSINDGVASYALSEEGTLLYASAKRPLSAISARHGRPKEWPRERAARTS